MCGLLIVSSAEEIEGLLPNLEISLNLLSHRGPDNISFWNNETIFLGHARLAIVGTGPEGNQPFFYENLAMVYNGEVFNYIELREELAQLGYRFDTTSDTEVVIKAFHCFGVDCFSRFNGMWALGIYDSDSGVTTICRDRFSQKPLFYSRDGSRLVVASEVQAIANIVKMTPDFPTIKSFLEEGDFDVGGHTFFEGISEFPSAYFVKFKGGEEIERRRYWNYPSEKVIDKYSADKFLSILEDAVAIRMRTDVDYCVLLSGGIDSTIVTGIMRKLIPNAKITAFTFSSQDALDESSYAQAIATALEIDLKICNIETSEAVYIQRLRRLVRHLGRGHSSPAVVSVDMLYENLSSEKFKVALDGQGADELLAGYKHYHFHLLFDNIRNRNWRQIGPLVIDLFREGIGNVLAMTLRSALPSWARRILRIIYGYDRLFSSGIESKSEDSPLWEQASAPRSYGYLDRYLYKQHATGLRNLLYYGDIVSMASSVENRSPFMDHRLVELSFRANNNLKVSDGINKFVLRKHPVFKQLKSFLDRRKIGFDTPIPVNVKAKMIADLMVSPILGWPIFNKEVIDSFLGSSDVLNPKFERLLFRIYQVHLWQHEFQIKT